MSIVEHIKYWAALKVMWPLFVKDKIRGKKPGMHGKKPFGPPLQITPKLKELMGKHYFEGRFSEKIRPVAWVTSGAPIEILRAMDFFIYYPENHGAMCSAQKISTELSKYAEERGFSMDLCVYARCDIGSVISGKTPVGKIPRPDILVACSNICQTVIYWYRSLSKQLGVPLVVIDTPFIYGDAPPQHIAYVKEQLERLIEVAEAVTARKLEREKLLKVLRLSADATLLWAEALAASRAKPAPWTAFDQFIHMAPIVTLRGTYECYSYYVELNDELRYRVYKGISAVEDEKIRVLWDNIPVWYRLRELATFLAERGVSLVASTYTNAWCETARFFIDAEDDPLEAMAKAYTYVILNKDLTHKFELMKSMVRDYSCHGVILHSDRSCKPYSIGQYDLRKKLLSEGIKATVVEADHGDYRFFSDEQVKNRLQAFIEMFG